MEQVNVESVATATEVPSNEDRQPESAASAVPEQRAAEGDYTEKTVPSDATNTDPDRHMSDVHNEATPTQPDPTEAPRDDVMEVDGDDNAGKQAEATGTAEVAVVAEAPNGVSAPTTTAVEAESTTAQQEEYVHVTAALEAALDSMLDGDEAVSNQGPQEVAPTGESAPVSGQQAEQQEQPQEQQGDGEAAGDEEAEGGQGVEWEVDSSPYASSSSDSDSDSSDDSDSEEEDASGATPVGLQDTVRMLMESAAMQAMYEDDDDDEDGGGGRGGAGGDGIVRSKNEIPEAAPPKPDVQIGADEQVLLLGQVMHLVENAAVIKGSDRASHPDSGRVLDTGTVLCTATREVLGVIADVIGNVRGPVYVLRVPREEDLATAGLVPGADVYYAPKHAVYVFTEALRGIKGSDASNLHDEEVAAEEAEFSDDEKEAAYKRELKARRRGGGGGGDNKSNRTGGGGSNQAQRNAAAHTNGGGGGGSSSGGLRYDENNDDDDDGPYKPLARPANFGHGPPAPPPRGPSGGVGGGGGAAFGRGGYGGGGNRGAFRGQQRFGRGGGRGGRGGRGGAAGGGGGGGGGGGWNNSSNGSSAGGPNNYTGGRYNDRPAMPAAPIQTPQPQQQGSGNGVAYFHGAPQQPQYHQPYQQQQHQQQPQQQPQQSVPASWPFAGLPFPPPPPPASSGQQLALPPSAANIAAAAALLSNLQQQQYWQQQQQQQQRPQQPPQPPPQQPPQQAWAPAVPMPYAQPQPQSHATPQFPSFPQWPPAQPGWGQQQQRPPSA